MVPNSYVPSKEILQKYADVLINFALNSGKGVNRGEVIHVRIPESAKPIFVPLRDTILKAGGHPIMEYVAEDVDSANFYKYADETELNFFPAQYYKGIIDQVDHSVVILSEYDLYSLKGVDPEKIMKRMSALKPFREWRDLKEDQGKYTWTMGLFGTDEMAKEAGMTLEEYWEEITKACYLNEVDPVAKWKQVFAEIERCKDALNALPIKNFIVESEAGELHIGLGKDRCFNGGSGRNIPSFEVFTSPDWRLVNGHYRFNQPIYRHGNKVEEINLDIRDGLVVKATCKTGQDYLEEMLKIENGNRIGEFSLTDARLSPITRFMAETLFDENMGGKFGNMHIAVGAGFHEAYIHNSPDMKLSDWDELGINTSTLHVDLVSTENRTVTAEMHDSSRQVIYKDGQFTL